GFSESCSSLVLIAAGGEIRYRRSSLGIGLASGDFYDPSPPEDPDAWRRPDSAGIPSIRGGLRQRQLRGLAWRLQERGGGQGNFQRSAHWRRWPMIAGARINSVPN